MIFDKAIRYTRAFDAHQAQRNRLVAFQKLLPCHKRIHIQGFPIDLNDPEIAKAVEEAFYRLYIDPANKAFGEAEWELRNV